MRNVHENTLNVKYNDLTTDDIRANALANGYEPIPCDGKRAIADDWQKYDVTNARLSAWKAEYPEATNTGLRTGRLVCVDNDIWDANISKAVQAILEKALDRSPLTRIGRKGAATFYRNSEPCKKIVVLGSPPDRPNDKPQKVEFLGNGQQVVAFGIHPDTGNSYRWTGKTPLDTAISELPAVTYTQLVEATAEIEAYFKTLGWLGVKVTDSNRHNEATPTGDPISGSMLTEMLKCIEPGLNRESWLAVAAAIKFGGIWDSDGEDIGEDRKQELFSQWSRGDFHFEEPVNFDGEEDCEKAFKSMKDKPGGAHIGSLIHMAREGGYKGEIQIPAMDHFIVWCRDNGVALDACDLSKLLHEPVPFSRLLAEPPKKVAELVPNWIEKGIAQSMSGPGGTNKSRFAKQLGHAIHNGQEILGLKTEKAFFVFLSAEE